MITMDRLPKWLFCIPFVAQWLWLGMRYGSLTLPSVVNPQIENGGLAGESKIVYLQQVDPKFQEWIVPTFAVKPSDLAERVRVEGGLAYPVIAKPDIGWCGYGVRKIDDADRLADYAKSFPSSAVFLIQPFLDQSFEAALFYVRQPSQAQGTLTAVTIRHRAFVKGDGSTTVSGLMQRDLTEGEQCRPSLTKAESERIPCAGEIVYRTNVASLRVGGRYEDATRMVTPELTKAVDNICSSMRGFHWGRLDVKFASENDLRAGKFVVFEINGAGSEAIHFWDPGKSVTEAFRGVFAKQRALFALAHEMRRAGYKPSSTLNLARAWLRQQHLIARYPPSN